MLVFKGRGSDIDGAAVSLTIANAKSRCDRLYSSRKRDIRDFKTETETGSSFVIRRMENACWISNRQKTYIKLWDRYFSQNMDGAIPLLLLMMSEQCYGRKADKRRKLYNGMIGANLYMYFK